MLCLTGCQSPSSQRASNAASQKHVSTAGYFSPQPGTTLLTKAH